MLGEEEWGRGLTKEERTVEGRKERGRWRRGSERKDEKTVNEVYEYIQRAID